jgi:hypothetical protein
MDFQTNKRIGNINNFYYEQKIKKINLIIIFISLSITMIVPYSFYLTNVLSKNTFLLFIVITMLSYLFYVMYKLDIYDIKSIYNQKIKKFTNRTERRFAEFINENCDCPSS